MLSRLWIVRMACGLLMSCGGVEPDLLGEQASGKAEILGARILCSPPYAQGGLSKEGTLESTMIAPC